MLWRIFLVIGFLVAGGLLCAAGKQLIEMGGYGRSLFFTLAGVGIGLVGLLSVLAGFFEAAGAFHRRALVRKR